MNARKMSLLERAAKVYDFEAEVRARGAIPGADRHAEAGDWHGPSPIPHAGLDPASIAPREQRPVAPAETWTPDQVRGDEEVRHAGLVPASTARQAPPAAAPVEQWTPAQGRGDGEFADTLSAIPTEFLASGDPDAEPVFPERDPTLALVDRGMLAENGMIVPGAPVGALAEEFRLVKRQLLVTRERIAASDQPDNKILSKARTVLVCSARPHDGKTFCAINLAISLAAERDLDVLLVDADVAKPDVMRRLGLPDGPGLLDALADPGLDVESLVRHTDVPHLAVLPAGTRTTTDTELLASARTRTVLQRLLEANPQRIVVFDSPPALAASPAGVLAMLVGQVMLVVRADRTPESDLSQSVQLLDGCEHIQLLLNAVAFVPGGHRYGYYGQETRQ